VWPSETDKPLHKGGNGHKLVYLSFPRRGPSNEARRITGILGERPIQQISQNAVLGWRPHPGELKTEGMAGFKCITNLSKKRYYQGNPIKKTICERDGMVRG